MIRQLQKTMQQQRVVQNQRLKSLKTLHEQYSKSQADLGIVHAKQQANITGELKKEMSTLQKKMMDDAVSYCLKYFSIYKELCLLLILYVSVVWCHYLWFWTPSLPCIMRSIHPPSMVCL